MKIPIVIIAALAGSASVAVAAPTIIDFEGQTHLTVLDNQYTGIGADFNGSAQILTAGSYNDADYPPFSGQNVAYDSSSVIRIDAVGGDWSYAGGHITGYVAITFEAFDSGNNSLGSVATPGNNTFGNSNGYQTNMLLSLSYPNIAYVKIYDGGNTFTLDDFGFEMSVIPLPSASALAGLGLLGIGVRRRRVSL